MNNRSSDYSDFMRLDETSESFFRILRDSHRLSRLQWLFRGFSIFYDTYIEPEAATASLATSRDQKKSEKISKSLESVSKSPEQSVRVSRKSDKNYWSLIKSDKVRRSQVKLFTPWYIHLTSRLYENYSRYIGVYVEYVVCHGDCICSRFWK